jgi:hypothetical protein
MTILCIIWVYGSVIILLMALNVCMNLLPDYIIVVFAPKTPFHAGGSLNVLLSPPLIYPG